MKKLVAHAAIFLLLPYLFLTPQANAQQSKHYTSNTNGGATKGPGTSEEQPVFIKVVPPAPDPRENERWATEQKEKADKVQIDHGILQYTEELARYTKYLYFATAALFIVTACLFGSALFQLRDSRRAVWAAAGSVDTGLSFLSFLKVYRTDVAHR